jgi:hypothetical protein
VPGDLVDQGEGFLVDRHHPLGVQLAPHRQLHPIRTIGTAGSG